MWLRTAERQQHVPSDQPRGKSGVEKGGGRADGEAQLQDQPVALPGNIEEQREHLPGKGEERTDGDIRTARDRKGNRVGKGQQRIERGNRNAIHGLLQDIGQAVLPSPTL